MPLYILFIDVEKVQPPRAQCSTKTTKQPSIERDARTERAHARFTHVRYITVTHRSIRHVAHREPAPRIFAYECENLHRRHAHAHALCVASGAHRGARDRSARNALHTRVFWRAAVREGACGVDTVVDVDGTERDVWVRKLSNARRGEGIRASRRGTQRARAEK